MGSLADKLAKAAADLGIPTVAPPGPIQTVYNRYRKHLHLRVIESPLPESVELRSENFLYWIKLEYPNLDVQGEWIQTKPNVVLPMLEAGTFDETGFRIDQKRANALFDIPNLLARPNCIHVNLRNQEDRGQGGIKGDHIYVAYHGKYTRTVAFTRFDTDMKKVILVSSFGASREWVAQCAKIPAKYIKPNCACSCK